MPSDGGHGYRISDYDFWAYYGDFVGATLDAEHHVIVRPSLHGYVWVEIEPGGAMIRITPDAAFALAHHLVTLSRLNR